MINEGYQRFGVVIAGALVIVLGLIVLPLPGPGGLPVILVGLGILSTELPWARRLLERLTQRMQRSHAKRLGARRPRKHLVVVTAGLFALYLIGVIVAWRVWAS